jgi:SAM-dependent methyltransferase
MMLPGKIERKCSICNSLKTKLLFKQHFSIISINGLLDGYDVVVCDNCGFCYADKIPLQPAFDTYYREMSKYEYQDHGNQVSKYDEARFKSTESYLRRFLHNREICILEIGCSTGRLLSIVKDNGFNNVLGIDPSPACAQAAQRLYGIRVQTGTLFESNVKAASVDVLIMVGVMEHIRELNLALQMIRVMLTEDGLLCIEVPDASCYDKGEDAPFQEFSLEHINFFGPVSLVNLLIANGFTLISLEQSMVEANFQTKTPAIRSVFKKSGNTFPPELTPDLQTEAGLRDYIHHSNQVDDQIQAEIERVVNAGRSIIVWGTGAHTLRLLTTSKLGRASIRAFVDSNPCYQGKELNGVKIVCPQEIKEWPEPILISSRVYQEEIAGQIVTDLHMKNEIIRLYSYDGI